MKLLVTITAVAAVLGAGAAAAGECLQPNWFQDALGRAPLTIGERCEFENAGSWKAPVEGGPVTAFSDSLVAQPITDLSCGAVNELWVADCATGDTATFHGTLCGGAALTIPHTSVGCFDGPDGLLEMTQSSTLSQLIASAEKNGITAKAGRIEDQLSEIPRHRRPEPTCGCKLYYPDSPGAKL